MAAPLAGQAGAVLRDLALRSARLRGEFPAVQLTPRRWLNLQEYQSKKIMADHGVTVQRFFVADSANDALEAAQRLNWLHLHTQLPRVIKLVHSCAHLLLTNPTQI